MKTHPSSSENGYAIVSEPKQKPRISLYVYLLTLVAVIGGFLFGYDTGIVSSAMLYVIHDAGMRPVSYTWHELIVSVTPGFAAVGSLLSGPCSDKYGRKKTIICSSFIFAIGAAICGFAPGKMTLLIGRILLGVAIGFASMIIPVYVSESSPTHIRGRLLTLFQLMITFGLLASNLLAGAFSYVDPEKTGWRLMFLFAATPAILQFFMFMCLPESPRWLHEQGHTDRARKTLNRIYNGDTQWVDYEMSEIRLAEEQLKHEMKKIPGDTSVISRILQTPHVLKALFIGCTLQAAQQMSGINTIMYYTGKIITSTGIENSQTAIWISCGISGVNFFATFVPLFFIERFGRRSLLLVSVFGVAMSLALMGGSFLLINRRSEPSLALRSADVGFPNAEYCSSHSNCDFCVTDEHCGFCQPEKGAPGYCLPYSKEESSLYSSTGVCGQSNGTSTEKSHNFLPEFCYTDFTVLPIILMVVYLSFFAIGYAPLPWVLNAEFYPLWARSTCVSISTATNWIFNLAISLTFLTLTQLLSKFGTFFLYSIITFFALLFGYFFVPETRGICIDEVEMLFMTKEARERKKAETYNMKESKQHDTSTDVYM